MNRVRAALTGVVAGLAFAAAPSCSHAQTVDPDDTPWSVNDANPGAHPNSIEEILSRDREGADDSEISPPGQDQPDYAAHPLPGELSEDRLTPKLPAQIDTGRERLPDTIRATEPAPAARPLRPAPPVLAQPAPGLDRAKPVAPSLQDKPLTAAPQPVAAQPLAGSPVQSAQPEKGSVSTQPAPAAANPLPSSAQARAPDAAPAAPTPPALTAPQPETAAKAQEGHDPTAAPPLAIPSEPVTQGAVAVNGKLYLPLKRYVDQKSESDLVKFDLTDRTALAAFYEKAVGEALWVTKDGFNDAAKSLIEEIQKADDWGLASADYQLPMLIAKGGDYTFEDLTSAEVQLSLVAMEYARHARGDRIDAPSEQLSSYIDRKPQLIEPAKLLEALAAAPDKGAYLRSLHPKHPQFELLREKLVELRKHQREGTEPERIPNGPKVTPGKEHWHVALVRRALKVPVPTAKADGSPADETYFDEVLARAVMDYKTKHQMEPVNATITDALRASLNQSTNVDEEKILANMEQWRWMPETMGETYVWVNIPEFLVRVEKHGQTIHEERVVTGRMETQTPVFSNVMRTVVFQPSWNVPESIKVNELLPKLRAGGNPIEGQGLRIERNGREMSAWDIDWSRQDIRNYHIFQPPGDSNVLGVVKFLFPNKHSVYLHDTPSKRLFNEKIRTFSHGCMRVRNPVRLAEVIMAEDKGWDKDKVDEMITSGPPDNDVALEHPLPVHVTYFTMWVSDNGEVQTFPDVYGHEKRIKLGLAGRWEEIEKNPDHLAPADPAAIATREDWGDQDDDTMQRARRTARLADGGDGDPMPRQAGVRNGPPQAGYKQIKPYAKSKPTFGDFISKIFGGN